MDSEKPFDFLEIEAMLEVEKSRKIRVTCACERGTDV